MKVDNLIVGKSKKLALRVMKLVQYLTQHKSPYFIIDQIGRSGTSIGANVIEAEHAISKKEFLMKMYIAYKECNETLYWLDLLQEARYISEESYQSFSTDLRELERILVSITKTTAESVKK